MKIKEIAFYLFSTFILMLPAFYNGYPLVYSDTGTYIISGMEWFVPVDRPVMYGLFIRFFSFQFSLWLVVFFQSLLVSVVLWHFCKLFYASLKESTYLFLLFILTWFTGLGWYCSLLMPDIFTAVAVCCTVLLLNRKKWSAKLQIFFSVLLVFSISVHFANFFIVALFLLVLLPLYKYYLKDEWKERKLSFAFTFLILFSSFGAKIISNYAVQGSISSNNSTHVFLMGRMLDSGVLKSFLDDNCKEENYVLCDCKDSLPANSRVLMWDGGSPFYKHGGWLNSQENYNAILKDIMWSPKHLSMFLFNSSFASVTQLLQSDFSSVFVDEWYRASDSAPYIGISKHFPHELNPYLLSLQNNHLWGETLDFTVINVIYRGLLIIGALFLLAIVMLPNFRNMLEKQTKFFLLMVFVANFVNAIIVATFANVYSRLQVRFSWLLVLICFIAISKMIQDYFQKRKL
jgi:hypothetical protein